MGTLHAAWLCGPILWLADSPLWKQPPGDIAAGLIGAEAFLQDAWRWPAAATARLMSEGRPVSIAYTDSLPLLMIVLKALGTAPAIVSPFAIAILIGQVLQPIAAGWALRRAGVSNWMALLPGALLIAWMPFWYFRLLGQHFPLTWHWLILVALGLAFGWCRTGRLSGYDVAGAIALCAASVATHVYLGVDVLALCLVGSLVLLRASRYLSAALLVATLIAASAAAAFAVGLVPPPDAGVSMGRFASPPGHYSFNVLAPFDFWYSALWPSARPIDGTGGQYEGMAYVGLGVFLLLGLYGLALVSRGLPALRAWLSGTQPGPAAVPVAVRRWQSWPLLVALLGLTVFAVYPNVWLGSHKVIALPVPPPLDLLLEQIRSGGRMIWPVIYALVIALIAGVAARADARLVGLAVTTLLIVQVADTSSLRDRIRSMIHEPSTMPATFKALRAAGALQGIVRLRPSWFCVGPKDRELAQVVALDVIRRGDTVHQPPLARGALNDCDPSLLATDQPLPNVTDIFFRDSLAAREVIAIYRRRLCDAIGTVLVCRGLRTTGEPSEEAVFLALMPPRHIGIGVRHPVARGEPAAQWLYSGWSGPEPWGTWTDGSKATVLIPLPEKGVVRGITLEMTAYSSRPTNSQGLRLSIAGKLLWQGRIPAGKKSTIEVPLDAKALTSGVVQLDFEIDRPQSPKDNGESIDARMLGIGLLAITLDGDG